MAAARPVVVMDEGALPELLALGDRGSARARATPPPSRIESWPPRRSRGGGVSVAGGAEAARQLDADAIAARMRARYRKLVEAR